MATPIPSGEIRSYLARHLTEVFDTMLALKAVPVADPEAQFSGERVSGSVGFAGEMVTGAVYLHLPATFAAQAAATMLGLPPEERAGEADVNDVIGEVTNMLAGGLKSWLCDAGFTCVLTTPAVIRGQSFAVVPSAGVERIPLGFECLTQRGLAEVHIKFS